MWASELYAVKWWRHPMNVSLSRFHVLFTHYSDLTCGVVVADVLYRAAPPREYTLQYRILNFDLQYKHMGVRGRQHA